MVVVIGEGRINLGQRQVGVLPLNLLGIPSSTRNTPITRQPKSYPKPAAGSPSICDRPTPQSTSLQK
jgi:hypothetical protein